MPGSWAGRWVKEGDRTTHPAAPAVLVTPSLQRAGLLALTSLLSVFEVGRPGAHHLVRVLHSDHEVSTLSPLLGCLTPGFTSCFSLLSEQEENLLQPLWSLVATPVLWGTPCWDSQSGREIVRLCVRVLSALGPGWVAGWWGGGRLRPLPKQMASRDLSPNPLHAPGPCPRVTALLCCLY